MQPPQSSAVDELVQRAHGGDRAAEQRLWGLLYDELRELAHKKRVPLHDVGMMQTTALVHEAYLKLARDVRWDFASLSAFYGAAARAMRNILVDEIRSKQRLKREGMAVRMPLSEALERVDVRADECLALDAALHKLEQHDAQLANLVNLRYFAGLEVERICELTGISPATYHRHWNYAKSWLLREVARLEDG